MRLFTAYQTKNPCYQTAQKMPKGKPEGIVVHSTGANNPTLKRYVYAPDEVGTNRYGNHWNRNIKQMVHAFIGYDKNNAVAVANTLPYDICCWGAGKGSKGSYNYSPAYVQFEICEDGLTDKTYFNAVFGAAIEFCAYLCKKYDIPVEKIVSHKEANREGYASNHRDCDHWLAKHGKTMEWFRNEVEELLNGKSEEINVGDIVEFNGGFHYKNANAQTGSKVGASLAKVTNVYAGKHPYHLRAVDENGKHISGVYGWVDESDIEKRKKADTPKIENTLKIGDKVKMSADATVYGKTYKFASWVYNKTLYVRGISGDKVTISTVKVGAVTGTVDIKYLTVIE